MGNKNVPSIPHRKNSDIIKFFALILISEASLKEICIFLILFIFLQGFSADPVLTFWKIILLFIIY